MASWNKQDVDSNCIQTAKCFCDCGMWTSGIEFDSGSSAQERNLDPASPCTFLPAYWSLPRHSNSCSKHRCSRTLRRLSAWRSTPRSTELPRRLSTVLQFSFKSTHRSVFHGGEMRTGTKTKRYCFRGMPVSLQIRQKFSRVTESEYTDEVGFRNGTQYDLRRKVEIVERLRAREESKK